MGIIYKTTNLRNGKIYIGKDKVNNPSYLGSGVILSQAIAKYGRDSFKKETLEECSDSIINERERYWISTLDSTNKNIGYNIAVGGTGGDTTSQHPEKELIVGKRTHGLKKWHESLSEEEKILRGKNISKSKTGKGNGRKDFRQSEKTKQLIAKNQPPKTDEWRKLHAEASAKRRGIPLTKKCKPVIVNNIEYPSVNHAMESLSIKHRATFYDRIKRGIIKVVYL